MAFPLFTLSGREVKQVATGETGRNLLLLLKTEKERQNTRELETWCLSGQEDTIVCAR